MGDTIYIKNMVCPRCIAAVTRVFNEQEIPLESIQLGEVTVSVKPSSAALKAIDSALQQQGFQLLNPGKSATIAKIKSVIIEQIHYSTEKLTVNFSTFLSDHLNQDYSSLSRLFSSVEGITIEKYITSQKIEKVKELLFYDELTLSQIAHQLDYSSVSHLSAQFKKETGMTPTAFKKQNMNQRKTLDDL